MKNILHILTLGVLTFLFSCGQNNEKQAKYNESRELLADPEGYKKDTMIIAESETSCNFDKVLSDPKTPELAKDLFKHTAKYSEESLTYFDNFKSKDKLTREFYFRVITNSYKIADGAYSEGLGNLGKEYIENNPQKFTSFFDNKACFTDEDLRTWAKIALLEFQILDENIEAGRDEPMVNGYCKKLFAASKGFSKTEKETINKFCNYLQNEWSDYLKKT